MTLLDVLKETPWLFYGSVFLLSLLVGSFLNVVIHRLPIMMNREWRAQATAMLAETGSPESPAPPPDALPAKYNLVVPRSACPHCGAPITALQNIPVVSWLVLGGRCARCKAPISPRYPAIELATAILSVLVAWRFGITGFTVAALVYTWVLVALTAIDIDHQLLPDSLTLPLLWLGLLLSTTTTPLGDPLIHAGTATFPTGMRDSIIGAAAGYLALWLVYQVFKLATGKEGMGFGDFKLLAALGAWLGWQMLPLVILLSAVSGATLGILMIVVRGRDRNIPIPFGPYLAAAGWIALLWGQEIVDVYLGQFQR